MLFRLLKLAVLLAVVGGIVGGALLFVFPDRDDPASADAVVVLAGGRKPRLSKGLTLMRRGVAPVLVISDAPAPGWPQANRLCRRGGSGFRVVCFKPDPYSTRGEAENVSELAARRNWRSIVVVTSTFHVTRSRMLFERCFDGDLAVVGADYELAQLPRYVASEWVKTIYALTLARGC